MTDIEIRIIAMNTAKEFLIRGQKVNDLLQSAQIIYFYLKTGKLYNSEEKTQN